MPLASVVQFSDPCRPIHGTICELSLLRAARELAMYLNSKDGECLRSLVAGDEARLPSYRALASLVVLLFSAWGAGAATPIVVVDGKLVGARGVEIVVYTGVPEPGGAVSMLFDVEFLDGTCVALFDGCDSDEDMNFFPTRFQGVDATSAAGALREQVFLDGPLGSFDSSPELTSGCESATGACVVLIPFNFLIINTQQGVPRPYFHSREYFNGVLEEQDTVSSSTLLSEQVAGTAGSNRVFAKFTPSTGASSVPALRPALLGVLALLLLGSAAFLRHRVQEAGGRP